MHIRYVGRLRSPAGWARAGRGLVRAFGALGHTVSAVEPDETPGPVTAAGPWLETDAADGDAAFTLAFVHPESWAALPGRPRIGVLEYDTSHLPESWVAAASALDLVVVPSDFCQGVAVGCGIPADKIAVVPFGHDPSLCYPEKIDAPFTFLHVAGPSFRHGTMGVVQAFAAAFEGVDGVRLRIKSLPGAAVPSEAGHRPPRPYLREVLARDVVDRFAPGDPRIEVIDSTITDEAMGDLFRAAHVFVLPAMANGFSLTTLEAMACGVPAIVTGWGGHLDYCTPQNSFVLHYNMTTAFEIQYDMEGDPQAPRGIAAQPDWDHLADAMHLAYTRPDIRAQKAEAARRDTAGLTWKNTANVLLEVLSSKGLI